MKNLFLEGPSRIGKTGLILDMLGEKICEAGGFSTVRLRYPDRSIAGYRVKEPSTMTSPDEDYREGLTNVFMHFTPDRRFIDETVFVRFAGAALSEAGSHRFLVMDEFGGVELVDRSFTDALKSVIVSDRPVIGVIKNREHAVRLMEKAGTGAGLLSLYDPLRGFIESSDSMILNMQDAGASAAALLIRKWMEENRI